MAFFDKFDIQHWRELLLFAYIIGIIFVLICFCVLLPFYAYVYKINREQDEKIAVFPIFDHLYEMIKKFYYLVSCVIPCIIFVHYISNEGTTRDAVAIVMAFILFLLHIIVEVLHLLISYLAIQRCLLFLFDSFEKQLVAVQNKILSNIWYLYILFIAIDIINLIYVPLKNPSNERKIFQAKMFFLACFIAFCYY
ncbi:hypothetical protein CRE_27955 [Caenorhabditis remanei]|uniref:Uncharacterized protein n=1 Tax=Caenorhabditis remanei TaxID=31234 RepID=E3NQ87_CAERE|nr:hypothetical protein CRE_27955 [Caenorhabditis remanei]